MILLTIAGSLFLIAAFGVSALMHVRAARAISDLSRYYMELGDLSVKLDKNCDLLGSRCETLEHRLNEIDPEEVY